MSKRRKLQVAFWFPVVIMAIRVAVTIWFLAANPFGLPFRYIQLVVIGDYFVYAFTYLKLFRDSVPVISLLVPSIVHFIVIYVFQRVLVLVPFGILIPIDIIFLIVKSIKASAFPFDVDGDEEEDLDTMFELMSKTE